MRVLFEQSDPGQEGVGEHLEELARFALKRLALPATTELSITFVDIDEMARLNGAYRGKEGPTDVLSFECDNLDDSFPVSRDEKGLYALGDVIIAPAIAQRQATEYETTFEEELELLLVHGILHLCGYDHIDDEEAAVMEGKQAELLRAWRSGEDEVSR